MGVQHTLLNTGMKIQVTGRIDGEGQLLLPLVDMRNRCKPYKNKRIVVTIDVLDGSCTENQKAYYFGYVIPTVPAAMKELGEVRNARNTDIMLRTSYPRYDGKQIEEFDRREMSDFLAWVQQYAAENLNVYIDDPM